MRCSKSGSTKKWSRSREYRQWQLKSKSNSGEITVRLGVSRICCSPLPAETPTDRAIREQAERLREAFPHVDFDDPGNHCARAQIVSYRRSVPVTTIINASPL
jgi:DNA-directed RNA polymerase subunit N (RpoN/RPB10)